MRVEVEWLDPLITVSDPILDARAEAPQILVNVNGGSECDVGYSANLKLLPLELQSKLSRINVPKP